MPRITGSVELPNTNQELLAAIVHILVEDTSRLDAPAIILGEQALDGIPMEQLQQGEIAFDVIVKAPRADANCSVRVHLDLDRNGVVSVGDYVSTEHIPVLQNTDTQPVRVSVRQVL